jgi:hypothetical protein
MTREAKAILGGAAVFGFLVGLAVLFQSLVMKMVSGAAGSGSGLTDSDRLAIAVSTFLLRYALFLVPIGLAVCVFGSLLLFGRGGARKQS